MVTSFRNPTNFTSVIRRPIVLSGLKALAFVSIVMGIASAPHATALAQTNDSGSASKGHSTVNGEKSFGADVDFLKQHVTVVELHDDAGKARVAVVPEYQGRVMTSSATGSAGTSFGWINYEHVAAGEIAPHINVYGGEERFWLGPEGGQFAIFFKPGTKFEFADWQTPPLIDTVPFNVVDSSDQSVSFRKEASLENYSRSTFDLRVDRTVKLLSADAAKESLGVDPGTLNFVGYRTTNRLTNIGESAWNPEKGLLSIWLLGMYKPGPETTVVIPFREGATSELGPVVNDAYFGKVPADRLKIDAGVMFFSGDGTYRSKIGVSPQRSLDVCGSYDDQRGVLTIVKFNKPASGPNGYVNSMWEMQEAPYGGDTVNAYNDGPPEPGAKPLGPFYELETSSPALALESGETGTHIQETFHLQGPADMLNRVSERVFGVSLEEITSALK